MSDDIHIRTASELFGVPPEQVTREMRSSAKAARFGLHYGIEPRFVLKGQHRDVNRSYYIADPRLVQARGNNVGFLFGQLVVVDPRLALTGTSFEMEGAIWQFRMELNLQAVEQALEITRFIGDEVTRAVTVDPAEKKPDG